MHNSQNSLDWAGSYFAILPCADCQGIATTIFLKNDNTYQLSQRYLGKENTDRISTGKFTWNAGGSKIKLGPKNGNRLLQVGENQIFWLDNKGNRVTGVHADSYRLIKQNNGINEKYWKLVTLNGQPVKPGGKSEAYIVFEQDGNKLLGNGGCNVLNGQYSLGNNGGIKIENVASTRMICPEMETEQKLINALQSANTFVVKEDILFLLNGTKDTLAQFQSTFLK